jgi:hypothetical protein
MQFGTYYIDGLWRQASAKYARDYLGLNNGVFIQDGPNLDAFSRLRVSNAESLFSSLFTYDIDPIQWEAGATGAGVAPFHVATNRMGAVSCAAGTGTSYLQTYEYHPYQPGKSQMILVTGLIGDGVANVRKEVGYFSLTNGIIYRQDGTNGLYFVRRTSTSGVTVDNPVAQADWNLDRLDGAGPSGLTLDPSKVYILVIDLQYLGMGRVRCGFDIDGQVIYAHAFHNANVLTTPYMQFASLPIQCLMTSTAAAAGATMYLKCAAVVSEGGFNESQARTFSTPEGTATAASGARTHILSLRPQTTYKTFNNRTTMILDHLNILVTGNNPVYWELVIGAAFTVAPTWAAVNTNYCSEEYGINGTFANLTNGLVIESGYIASTASSKESISSIVSTRRPITLDRAGANRNLGTLSLLVQGIGGNSATRASMCFEEIR